MERSAADRILDAQTALRNNADHQSLVEEYNKQSERFMACISLMTQEQRDTVLDYIGVLSELHMQIMIYLTEERREL